MATFIKYLFVWLFFSLLLCLLMAIVLRVGGGYIPRPKKDWIEIVNRIPMIFSISGVVVCVFMQKFDL
jgi:hypothetical protein